MIKIGVIGSHGCGKTTACLDIALGLKKEGVNARILDEIATDLPRLPGFSINEGTTELAQTYILLDQMRREILFEAIGHIEVGIFDRIVLDNYAYFERAGFVNPFVESFIKNHSLTGYSLIFKMSRNPNYLVNDGVRSTINQFQADIDNIVERLLANWKVPFQRYTDARSATEQILAIRNGLRK